MTKLAVSLEVLPAATILPFPEREATHPVSENTGARPQLPAPEPAQATAPPVAAPDAAAVNAPARLPSKTTRLAPQELTLLFPSDPERSAAAEQYRIIRTKILHHAKRPRLIVVSSASTGDGKTVTSINLAASIAMKGDRDVLLVDADLRRPRVASALEIPGGPGLSEVIAGKAQLESSLIRAEQFPNLYILPAGDTGHNPAELLDSGKWRALIQEMRARFDLVIFDATPVSVVADYELMQLVSDGVVLVARPDHTNRKECARVLGSIPKEKLLGVVLNCVEQTWFWKANSYYAYDKKT